MDGEKQGAEKKLQLPQPPAPLFPFHWADFNTNTIERARTLTMARGESEVIL